jgi:hypothetical protein
MGQLTNLYVSESYQGLIKLTDSTTGVTGNLQYLQDGLGNRLPMQMSTSSVSITGSLFGTASYATQALSASWAPDNTDTGSYVTTSSFNAYTSSNDSKVNSLISATGSYATTSSLTSLSSSIATTDLSQNNRLTSIEGITGSLATTSSLTSLSQSIAVTDLGQDNRLGSLETATGSLQNQINQKLDTGSFNSYTSSNDGKVNSLISATGSYATTGSNVFQGLQTISGSLIVTGSITALSASITYLQTVYQTSSVVFSSGSNILGDEASDTQTLNGLVNIPLGNLNVTGATTSSLGFFGNLQGTASFATNALSASYAPDTTNTGSLVTNVQGGPISFEDDIVVTKGDGTTSTITINNVNNAVSSSYSTNALSASFSQNTISSSFSNFAVSASQAQNAVSASYAPSVAPVGVITTGSISTTQSITGSLIVSGTLRGTGSVVLNNLTYPTVDGLVGQVIETDGAGNLIFDDVHTLLEDVFSGEAITKGDPLYISGSQGAKPKVFRADASNAAKMPVSFVALDTVGSNTDTRGIVLGLIEGMNLTGYNAGDAVYVAEGGGWSTSRPSGSASITQLLGVVTKGGTGGKGLVLNPGPATLPTLQTGKLWIGNSTNQPISQSISEIGLATTGSNTFNGNQIINGSVNINNPIATGNINIQVESGSFTKAAINLQAEKSFIQAQGDLFFLNTWDTNSSGSISFNSPNQINFLATSSVTISGSNNVTIRSSNIDVTGSLNVKGTQNISGSLNMVGNSAIIIPSSSKINLYGDDTVGGFPGAIGFFANTSTVQSLNIQARPNGSGSVAISEYPINNHFMFFNMPAHSIEFEAPLSSTSSLSTIDVLNGMNIGMNQTSSNVGLKVTGSLNVTGSEHRIIGSTIITGSVTLSGSAGVELDVKGDQTNTGSVNILGPLNLRGNQTISGSLLTNTLNDGLIKIVTEAQNSSSLAVPFGYISASAAVSQSNLVFGLVVGSGAGQLANSFTGSIVISGSNNIITSGNRQNTLSSGTYGYIGGNANFVSVIPTLTTSSLLRPTISNNNLNSSLSLAFTTSSLVGPSFATNNVLNSVTINHQSASLTYSQNINVGGVTSTANNITLPFLTTIQQNYFGSTQLNFNHISSSITSTSNILGGGAFTVTNLVSSSLSATNNGLSFNNNLVVGQANGVWVSGSNPTNRRNITSNIIGGVNTAVSSSQIGAEAHLYGTVVFGQNLIVSASHTFANGGSAFFGRYNDTTTLSDSQNIVFAVGTGTAVGTRRTGLYVTSGSLVGVSGSLQVIGDGVFTGSLILSGSANPELTVIGNTILTGSVQGNVLPLTVASSTASLDLNNGNFFELALTGSQNIFINPSNIKPGQTVNIKLNTTGSGTVTFPTSVKQPSGSAYTPTTAVGTDIITMVSFDSTNLFVANVKNLI